MDPESARTSPNHTVETKFLVVLLCDVSQDSGELVVYTETDSGYKIAELLFKYENINCIVYGCYNLCEIVKIIKPANARYSAECSPIHDKKILENEMAIADSGAYHL